MSNNKYFLNSYKVLYNIFKNKAYSSIELNKLLQTISEDADKALITRIVYGVLENNIKLEYIIRQFAKKKPKLPTYIILKMGTYASLYLNSIPNYAIVNELVNLTKHVSKRQESGFVNKVLKNILDKKFAMPDKSNYLEYLSIKHSYPLWLLKKLKSQYCIKVLESLIQNNQKHLKHIRINLTKTNVNEFKNILNKYNVTFEPSVFDNALFVNYAKLKLINELNGLYAVQSLGSNFIVRTIGVKNGAQVLDTCSAPGGKACYIAEINKKGWVTAFDVHEHRINLIKKYADNMGVKNITTKIQDSSKLNENLKNKFDYILCDVPCSGIGVINKKPDILLFKKESDIEPLTKLQYDILDTASNYVKDNGFLIYSTCTLLKEENIEIINKFLKEHPNFKLTKIDTDNLNYIKEKETITLLPDMNNNESYFVARLQKL